MSLRDIFNGLYKRCECGHKSCLISIIDNKGRFKKFKQGHNSHGPNHPNWKGGRRNRSKIVNYVELWMPWHPNCRKDKHIFEHVWVMTRFIKRPLMDKEEVHHINHIKDDNRIENLMLFENHAEHMRFELTKNMQDRVCKDCGSKETLFTKRGFFQWFGNEIDGFRCNKCYCRYKRKFGD